MTLRPAYADPLYRRPSYSSPGALPAVPILEQIAAWHKDAISLITVANGCSQTLTVWREGAMEGAGDRVRDLTTICSLGEHVEADMASEDADHYCWRQSFDARVYVFGAAGRNEGEDPRIIDIIKDIHSVVAAELYAGDDALATGAGSRNLYCYGLAYDLRPMPWWIGMDPHVKRPCVVVPILISYEVLKLDPCGQ